MDIYTNLGLVKHAEMALSLKTAYMWAGTLYPISPAYVDQKNKQCKLAGLTAATTGYTNSRLQYLKSLKGEDYYGVDCVCLIKSYYWSGKPNGGVKSPCYAGYNDVNANVMFNMAKVKGKISTIPERPGVIVYCKSHPHVGIYVGNGYTIESTLGSRGDGVVKRKLDDFWEYWFECPFIEYVKEKDTNFKVGNKVKIKKTAQYYAGAASKTKIPEWVKDGTYTISQVNGTMSLLKEIYSWVKNEDLEKV